MHKFYAGSTHVDVVHQDVVHSAPFVGLVLHTPARHKSKPLRVKFLNLHPLAVRGDDSARCVAALVAGASARLEEPARADGLHWRRGHRQTALGTGQSLAHERCCCHGMTLHRRRPSHRRRREFAGASDRHVRQHDENERSPLTAIMGAGRGHSASGCGRGQDAPHRNQKHFCSQKRSSRTRYLAE